MPFASEEEKKAWKADWYQRVVKPRREKWIKDNGPCVDCGSWENLEVDHEDRKKKVDHRIWSWSEKRRTEELKKCKVRCKDCHAKKSTRERHEMGLYESMRVKCQDGMAWCYKGKHFVPIEEFHKNAAKADGRNDECKACRRTRVNGRWKPVEGVVHGETTGLENQRMSEHPA